MQDQEGHVLVVDDDEALTEVYAAWLDERYTVETATSGEAALAALDDHIEVVLLDRRMPELPGEAVLQQVREQGYDCRVAMVTGIRPDTDVLEMGFDDYLVKPVDGDDLLELVDRLLERQTYDDRLQEYYALASKRATLQTEAERAAADDTPRTPDQYQEAIETVDDRLETVQTEMTQVVESFHFDDFRVAFRDLEVADGD